MEIFTLRWWTKIQNYYTNKAIKTSWEALTGKRDRKEAEKEYQQLRNKAVWVQQRIIDKYGEDAT